MPPVNKEVELVCADCARRHCVLYEMIRTELSRHRQEHSERVARICVHLALHHGEDVEHAFLAGIAHDICREYTVTALYNVIDDSYFSINAQEKRYPILLHAKAAVMYLKKKYPLSQSVYDAILTHSTGDAMISGLQKIVFLGDSLEPKRTLWNGREDIRMHVLSLGELDVMVRKVKKIMKEVWKKGGVQQTDGVP